MKLSQESFLGLKRHFLGALSGPSTFRIVPEAGPRLVLTSDALRRDSRGVVVDFGTLASAGEERRTLRVVNLGPEPLTLRLRSSTPWLEAHWLQGDGETVHVGGAGAGLELVAGHDVLEDRVLAGGFELIAEDLSGESQVFELPVRLAIRRTQPLGLYDFQGSEEPRRFDFGVLDPGSPVPPAPCTLSFGNLTSVPLQVSFSDLPAWLVFEVDGYQRRGPVAGRFFERKAPFQVEVRPIPAVQFLGSREDRLLLRTDDARPERRKVDLEFAARIEPQRPCVALKEALEPVRIDSAEPFWVEAALVNQGRSAARLSLKASSPGLQLHDRPVVPGARDGQAGEATLRIRVSPAQLPPDPRALSVSLRVDGGEPPEITVPVPLIHLPPREAGGGATTRTAPLSRPGVAVFFLVLLLIVLFALLSGALSGVSP